MGLSSRIFGSHQRYRFVNLYFNYKYYKSVVDFIVNNFKLWRYDYEIIIDSGDGEVISMFLKEMQDHKIKFTHIRIDGEITF